MKFEGIPRRRGGCWEPTHGCYPLIWVSASEAPTQLPLMEPAGWRRGDLTCNLLFEYLSTYNKVIKTQTFSVFQFT